MSNAGGRIVTSAAKAPFGSSSMAAEVTPGGSFPIVELRQYTLFDGLRDKLINLFEREFVESQETLGAKVIGTFIDIDRPNRFVWLRGFKDMDSRAAALAAFYSGPIWQAHRDEANATMIDSDNVFLLHAPGSVAEFRLPGTRPSSGEQAPGGLIAGSIHHLNSSPAVALGVFEMTVKPRLIAAGVEPIAWFVPETSSNSFPRLPVREGERVLVWFARFDDEADHRHHQAACADAVAVLAPLLASEPQTLRLKPTSRSELR